VSPGVVVLARLPSASCTTGGCSAVAGRGVRFSSASGLPVGWLFGRILRPSCTVLLAARGEAAGAVCSWPPSCRHGVQRPWPVAVGCSPQGGARSVGVASDTALRLLRQPARQCPSERVWAGCQGSEVGGGSLRCPRVLA
jgi:hypothetical protein